MVKMVLDFEQEIVMDILHKADDRITMKESAIIAH
jgi:hypothetical protein